ncbi:chorismate synthase [Caproiciproducens galactitolivorans]|uniref:Chorismate synthase n=1 Tax=Caproiciproducens galactitolivorans TaxID=642589 RepID=A0ABT4BSK4_9FIRM|nr:chorismate synthase [Caproiciproducens galactitolivorans]MCY1713870.1 chorismate synthase [Caproiciproducens galactitolivorans]
MSSTWGEKIKISIFGESHGAAIGVVLDGLPAGEELDFDAIALQMSRRAPGKDATATPRKESDLPNIVSGVLNGRTTGAPLCALMENTNTKSGDYENLKRIPRPGHADYPAYLRYGGFNDVRGGGHFSGRLTAPLVFAGAVCRQILQRRGIRIGSHVYSVSDCKDTPFSPSDIPEDLLQKLSSVPFPVINRDAEQAMRDTIEKARMAQDSVGGVIECALTGVPAGIGGPLFGGIEPVFSSILFGIPAVKGVEFGAGFGAAELYGSENNDAYYYEDGTVKTRTNNAGGILGGITTGMPIVFRAAFKPTPSIAREQDSIDLTAKTDAKLHVHGRHDPCIVSRAAPVVEAAAAIALINLMNL